LEKNILATRKWKARVKLSNGSQQVVYVDADTQRNAIAMIESQYGKGCMYGGVPTPA